MRDDDLTQWALTVPLPSTRSIGVHATRLLLVALVQHANRDGIAWPSPQTLASEVAGMTRRHAREALAVMEANGVIRPAEPKRPGRATRWQVIANLAGIPATFAPTNLAGDLAGDLAGHLAGHLAGIPATNRREENLPPTPQAADPHRRTKSRNVAGEGTPSIPVRVADALRAAGIPDEAHAHAWQLAHDDPATKNPAARLAVPAYAQHIGELMTSQDQAAREAARKAKPRCVDHELEHIGSCTGCAADHKAGEHAGRPRPHCHICAPAYQEYVA